MSRARRVNFFVGALLCLLCSSLSIAQERIAPRRLPVMVAVGDSITAGFANATLVEETQRLSYPALIAKQMGIPFGQPYVSEPGLPALGFHFKRAEHVLEMPYLSLRGSRRIEASNDAVHNFAVPNARLWEVLTLQEKPGNALD